jgi:hypothetical protein
MPNTPKSVHVLAFANVQVLDVTGPLQVFGPWARLAGALCADCRRCRWRGGDVVGGVGADG